MTDSLAFGGLTFKRRRGHYYRHVSVVIPPVEEGVIITESEEDLLTEDGEQLLTED